MRRYEWYTIWLAMWWVIFSLYGVGACAFLLYGMWVVGVLFGVLTVVAGSFAVYSQLKRKEFM